MASRILSLLFLLGFVYSDAQAQTKPTEQNNNNVQQETAQDTAEEQPERQEKEFETFDPSVEISTDNPVSFPTDI